MRIKSGYNYLMTAQKKIPNLNTISTFIDRWIIEHVKLSIFEERLTNLDHLKSVNDLLLNNDVNGAKKYINDVRRDYELMLPKIKTQNEIISAIRSEFEDVLNDVFVK